MGVQWKIRFSRKGGGGSPKTSTLGGIDSKRGGGLVEELGERGGRGVFHWGLMPQCTFWITQLTFICSKSKIAKRGKGVKYVQSQ